MIKIFIELLIVHEKLVMIILQDENAFMNYYEIHIIDIWHVSA